jgi:hypothetical protein
MAAFSRGQVFFRPDVPRLNAISSIASWAGSGYPSKSG